MTEEELVKLARENLGEESIDNATDAVLAFHGHGVADDTTGDVEAPRGHIVRVDRFIVRTDERFTVMEDYESEDQARGAFAAYEDEYSNWVDGDEPTYMVRRFHTDDQHPDHHKVIETGLTLAEAQAHCQRKDTHGDGWFDGYDQEA